ncbi:MAG: hydroxyacylglutathione hydrolase [Betaproteobacteria bacterium]
MAEIIPIPAFADNYIWMLRVGDVAAIVDPGDATPVIGYLEREVVVPCAILATHHHGDHVGGIPALLARWPVPVFGPAREKIPGRTQALSGGDSIFVPGIDATFDVIDVPGHTAGHVALFGEFDGGPVLFCGDTLFTGGCGRLFEGTPVQMWSSLSALAALPPETRIYCGHEYTLANLRFALAVEPDSMEVKARDALERAKRDRGEPTVPATMDIERATNPFLRAHLPQVKAAAAAHAGHALTDDIASFAALREWKNQF